MKNNENINNCDKLSYAIESFKNIQELIRFSDQKAGVILLLLGFIITAFIDLLKELQLDLNKLNCINILTFLAALSTLVCLGVVFYLTVFKILSPRLAKTYNKNHYSLFYFEHLASNGKNKIYQSYSNVNSHKMLKDITDQQFEVSNILVKKNKYLYYSFQWLAITFLMFIIFLLLFIHL